MKNKSINDIVLGTAGLAGIWGPVDFKESEDTLLFALESGIRYFDTSPAYANAETILGNAINSWKGTRPYISTKAGKLKADKPDSVAYDFSPTGLKRSVAESLDTLKIDCIDILFLHDPSGMKINEIPAAIETLQEIKLMGWAKEIGIGGNYGTDFESFVSNNSFNYFMGYNRFNIINQKAVDNEFVHLKNEQIKIWQASPLYMGLLGSKLQQYVNMLPEWIPAEDIESAKQLDLFCKRTNVSITGLALHYILSSHQVNKLVLGASNMNELVNTLEILNDAPTYQSILDEKF